MQNMEKLYTILTWACGLIHLVQGQEFVFVTSLLDFQQALDENAAHIVIGAHLDFRSAVALPQNMTLAVGVAANWWGTKSIRVRCPPRLRRSLACAQLALSQSLTRTIMRHLFALSFSKLWSARLGARRGTAVPTACCRGHYLACTHTHDRYLMSYMKRKHACCSIALLLFCMGTHSCGLSCYRKQSQFPPTAVSCSCSGRASSQRIPTLSPEILFLPMNFGPVYHSIVLQGNCTNMPDPYPLPSPRTTDAQCVLTVSNDFLENEGQLWISDLYISLQRRPQATKQATLFATRGDLVLSHVVVAGGGATARAVDVQYPQTERWLKQAPWLQGRRGRLLAEGTAPTHPRQHCAIAPCMSTAGTRARMCVQRTKPGHCHCGACLERPNLFPVLCSRLYLHTGPNTTPIWLTSSRTIPSSHVFSSPRAS